MATYSRFRERGAFSIPVARTETYNIASCANRTPLVINYVATWQQGIYEAMWDMNIPGWHKRQGKEIVFNDLVQTKSTRQIFGSSSFTLTVLTPCTSPTVYQTDNQTGHLLPFHLGWSVNPPTIGPAMDTVRKKSLEDAVWTKCLANRGKGKAALLESIAELDKTFRMVGSPFENISNYVKKFRRTAKRSKGYKQVSAQGKAFIEFTASEYLRFMFGVMPLIKDAGDVMEALEHSHPEISRMYTARAQQEARFNVRESFLFSNSAITFTWYKDTVHLYKVRCLFNDFWKMSVWNDLGFNLRDLLLLPFELVRYSYVLDWVVNASDVIAANAPRVEVAQAGGCMTTFDDHRSVITAGPITATNPTVRSVSGSMSEFILLQYVTKERHPREGGSVFVVQDDFKLDNFTRAAEAAASAVTWLQSIGFDRHTKKGRYF